jgi:hypothetical protein
MSGGGEKAVRDLTPSGDAESMPPPACDGCSLADVIERKEREARGAAWAGVLAAILGTMSWQTIGFAGGGVGAIAFGLFARNFAPREARAAYVAGILALVVLALRLNDRL